MPDFSFKFAERCLYEYQGNMARLAALREKLMSLYGSSSMKAQNYDPIDHSSGPGDPVAVRTLSILTLEEEIGRLAKRTEPITRLLAVLDAPFVLEGTILEGLANVARMHYFAKRPKGETAKELKVDVRTLYNMRVRLVTLVIKYMKLRKESERRFPILDENPCYTDIGK